MEQWHPGAERVIPTARAGLSHIGAPWKIVLHTTEGYNYSPSTSSYYGHQNWPHATITPGRIYQHFPLSKAVYTLAHDWGPETNRANAIQCEVAWRAENPNWPDDLLDTLADWIRWVQAQTGVPTRFAEMWRPNTVTATTSSPLRLSGDGFVDFHGICGHSNVPGGNDHWDPGRLPVDHLTARLAGELPPDPPKEDDNMLMFWHGGAIFLDFHGRISPFGLTPETIQGLMAAGVRVVGKPGDVSELMLMFGDATPVEGTIDYPPDFLEQNGWLGDFLTVERGRRM